MSVVPGLFSTSVNCPFDFDGLREGVPKRLSESAPKSATRVVLRDTVLIFFGGSGEGGADILLRYMTRQYFQTLEAVFPDTESRGERTL